MWLLEPVTLLQKFLAVGSIVKPGGTVSGVTGNRARQDPADDAPLVCLCQS